MKRAIFFIVFLMVIATALGQHSILGKRVANVNLTNTSDKVVGIPALGEKVLIVFYTDPDVKDVNDPLSEGLKKRGIPADKFQGIGIVNCKASWIPNAAIRLKSKQKEKQFPGSVVLLDERERIKTLWGLGDCDGRGVAIVIGKDTKVKFIQYVKTQEESSSLLPSVTKLILEEVNK